MFAGPRLTRIQNLQQGCITCCCRCLSARRRRQRAGVLKKAETDTVEPVAPAESVSSVDLPDRGVGCAMGLAAASASAEPAPPSMGMAKSDATTVSAAVEIYPRPIQPSAVAIEPCKPCTEPHDSGDMPKYLPAGVTQYVLNNLCKKSPPYSIRRFDSPPTAEGGADFQSSVGTGARWRHRGAIQDALDRTLRTSV